MSKLVFFGEILLRLSAPLHQRLQQLNHLDICVGGAEANVAAALAQWGHQVELVSVLPACNALAENAISALRSVGVGTQFVQQKAGRMGLYFFEQGAMQRASEVTYDRANSSFSELSADQFDWLKIFQDANRLHLSGVTPALGAEPGRAAIAAARAAQISGVPVSFDGNFRSKLWETWGGNPRATLFELMSCADVLFANHRDIALVLNMKFDEASAKHAFIHAAEVAFENFPLLRHFAATARLPGAVEQQSLGAMLALRDGTIFEAKPLLLNNIVDRIGAGDAFAAGFLHGLQHSWLPQRMLDFALAAGGYKHSITGDMTRCSVADVESWMMSTEADVKR